jgi:hypothetical protein
MLQRLAASGAHYDKRINVQRICALSTYYVVPAQTGFKVR